MSCKYRIGKRKFNQLLFVGKEYNLDFRGESQWLEAWREKLVSVKRWKSLSRCVPKKYIFKGDIFGQFPKHWILEIRRKQFS